MIRHKLALSLALSLASGAMLTSPSWSEEEVLPATGNASAQSGAINRNASALSPQTTMSAQGKEAFNETRPRLVLALSGGACKTVAEIGVLRSLEQHNIKVDGIVGTSMGATIGSLYCSGMSVNDIEALFLENNIQSAMMKGLRMSVVTKLFAPITYLFKGRPYAGMTDGKPFLTFLERKLPATFEELKIPFASVVTNLTDGQTEVLAHGNLPKAVFASCCVPTIYRPIMIGNKLYVDGGLKANLPSNIAQSMGADIVVAALVDTAVTSIANEKFKSKNALTLRIMNIMMASSDNMQTRSSDILIYPDVDFLPWVTKDKEIIRRGIEAGQKATDSVIPRITEELLALSKSPKDNKAKASTPQAKTQTGR